MTTDANSLAVKLGIIAGGGQLPVLLADACRESGRPYLILGLEGFATPDQLSGYEHVWMPLGSVGKAIDVLKENDCAQIVMAGHVTRPDFKSIKLDWRAAKLLPQFLSAARRGDDALLSVMVETFEGEGFSVVGADEILQSLLIEPGPLGAVMPDEHALQDIKRGIEVVQKIGALDIGQGAVICNQLVLAVEAVEGTDAMLQRCLDITTDLRGTPDQRRGVLVKIPKPGQERRVDLPTIGIRTLERAVEIGLSGVAVAAGGALVLGRETVVPFADRHGLFIFGIDDKMLGGL